MSVRGVGPSRRGPKGLYGPAGSEGGVGAVVPGDAKLSQAAGTR